jgi:hypothetical protein
MNRTIAAAIVAAACVLTAPALALAETAIVYGAGAHNGGCGDWMRATEDSVPETAYRSWLLGYLSAVNAFVPGFTDVTEGRSNSSVLDWMQLWCRNHPLDKAVAAVEALLKELSSRQGGPAPSAQPAPRVSKIPRAPDQLVPSR